MSDTISSMKEKMQHLTGLPPDYQRVSALWRPLWLWLSVPCVVVYTCAHARLICPALCSPCLPLPPPCCSLAPSLQVVSHGRLLLDEDTVRNIPAIHNRRNALHIIPKIPAAESEGAVPCAEQKVVDTATTPPCPATTSSYQFFSSIGDRRALSSSISDRCVLPPALPCMRWYICDV